MPTSFELQNSSGFFEPSSKSIYWDAGTVRQVCACSDLDDTYILESLKSDY